MLLELSLIASAGGLVLGLIGGWRFADRRPGGKSLLVAATISVALGSLLGVLAGIGALEP
jgi:hypothetical protein